MPEFTIAPYSLSYPVMGFLLHYRIENGKHREVVYAYATAYMQGLRSAELVDGPASVVPVSLHVKLMNVLTCYVDSSDDVKAPLVAMLLNHLRDNLNNAYRYCVVNSDRVKEGK